MIDQLTIENTSGDRTIVDSLVLRIDVNTTAYVFGIDFEAYGGWNNIIAGSTNNYQTTYPGKLDQIGFLTRSLLFKNLDDQCWDFNQYPNPEIIFVTRKYDKYS